MDRTTAVAIWREVCGSYAVNAVMAGMPPTGRVIEEFARRIEATERERCAQQFVENGRDIGRQEERERCAKVVRYWLAGYATDTVASHEARCLAHVLDGRPAPEGPNA